MLNSNIIILVNDNNIRRLVSSVNCYSLSNDVVFNNTYFSEN